MTVDGKPHLGRGTVRFLGPVKFSSKDNWAGVELDSPGTTIMFLQYCKEYLFYFPYNIVNYLFIQY